MTATLAALGPVIWYVFVTAATPGPNNAMLAAYDMNFGVRRTVLHILGIDIGLMVLLFICGLGLGVLFQTIPYAKLTFSIIGSAYLLYLAWRISAPRASARLCRWQKRRYQRPLTIQHVAVGRDAMRRAWLRGRQNVHKRYLIHVAGFNLGILMRALFGSGTPKQAASARAAAVLIVQAD